MSEPGEEPEITLPPLQMAVLDAATLEQLFFDIEHAAELIGVQLKAGPGYAAEADVPTVARARELLTTGAVIGVQLRYRARGAVWCDTLMRTPDGVRLVRVEQSR